jgi:hypothetical protein
MLTYILFSFTDHAYDNFFLKKSLSEIAFTSLSLVFVTVEFLSLEELCCLGFSNFLCFCIGICTFEAKSLEVLITYSHSIEVFSIFRKDCFIAGDISHHWTGAMAE